MEVVAIVGLPGSGKTKLIKEYEANGYPCFDDMNRNWVRSTRRMQRLISQKRDIACSDIMFCTKLFRRRLERTLGVPIHWIFFDNNPWECAKNCLYRYFFQKRDRPLQQEIKMIRRLSRVYVPAGDVRPVVSAEAESSNQFSNEKAGAPPLPAGEDAARAEPLPPETPPLETSS